MKPFNAAARTARPHPADRADTAEPTSVDDLARGRRLVALLVLTSCAWLLAVLMLWSSAAPETSEGVPALTGDATGVGADQDRLFGELTEAPR